MWCAGLIPAFRSQPIARLRSRARLFRGETKPEGPFGEWMGYYSDDTQERPFVRVKTILHRNDPILTCAPSTNRLTRRAGAGPRWFAIVRLGLQVIPIPSQFPLVSGPFPSDYGSSRFAGQDGDKAGDKITSR